MAMQTWQPAKKALSCEESETLLRACHSVEEKFLILLMLTTGMRRTEIVGLRFHDIDLEAKTILVRKGKGGRSRTLPLADSLIPLIVAIHYKNDDGMLVRGQHGTGLTSGAGFYYTFRRIAKRAGFKGLHPHCLRHTFAMMLIKNGASIYAVKDMLGHRKVSTTENYLHGADMNMMRDALEKNPFSK